MWLGVIYTLGLDHRDPLLTVRQHRLQVTDDGDEFRLVPGYSKATPEGDVVGMGGLSRRWADLLADLARYGLGVDVLEPGVFRASAYVLEQAKNGKWRVDASSRKSKRGRPHEPAVAARDAAIVEEYKRDRYQSHKEIADKVAPEFPGLKCGREQVRKAIASYPGLENTTGKK